MKNRQTTYAATHPGKMGDCLYTLPFLRYVYGVTGRKIDFFSSSYCEPLRALFEYQHFINSFNIAKDYKIERMDMGIQPWQISVPANYEHVFQLGFQSVPDCSIHQFIAKCQGISIELGISYDYPSRISIPIKKDYIVIAPRGETSYKNVFNAVADETNAVIVGGIGDYTGHGLDATGLDMLETASVIARSRGFFGLMSSQLVIANGFDIPRISPHDDKSWDMRHVIYSKYNHYPVNPCADDILRLL